MIKKILLLNLLIFISHLIKAQQTLFNVVTPEITQHKQLYFQQEASIAHDIELGTTFTYGFGHDFEAGINLIDLTITPKPSQGNDKISLDPSHPDRSPDIIFNAQKGFKINNWLKLGVGTRSGPSLARSWEEVSFVSFNYLNTQFTIPKTQNKFIVGTYYGNYQYVGNGSKLGFMLGADLPIIKEHLNFQGDFISGNSSISVIALGLGIKLVKEWQFGFGGQIPTPGSNNNYAVSIQISNH